MMLSKSLVSFIAAFAVATSVSAASTPMARGGSPPPIDASQCDVGSLSCCETTESGSNPLVGVLSGLAGVPLNLNALIGLTCTELLLTSTQCNGDPVCCTNVDQSGLVNFGCSPVNLGL